MGVITAGRRDEYEHVVAATSHWARRQTDIKGVAVVGSWARDEARMDSDIDLVILTDRKARYAQDADWIASAVGQDAVLIRSQEWGVLTERRVRLPSGLEVEFGFVFPSWAATDPVDPGTARVVRDGCRPILDPEALFSDLIAVASST
jgi:predicted nucleotidyltransferase